MFHQSVSLPIRYFQSETYIVHICLPDHYSPQKMGLIIPQTSDGRVLFFLVSCCLLSTFFLVSLESIHIMDLIYFFSNIFPDELTTALGRWNYCWYNRC